MIKNNEYVRELFENNLRDLFKNFLQIHQVFRNEFNRIDYCTQVNDIKGETIEWLDDEIDISSITNGGEFYNEGEGAEVVQPRDTIFNISIYVELSEPKLIMGAFSMESKLEVIFEPSVYKIPSVMFLAEKRYNEYLTDREKERIYRHFVKLVRIAIMQRARSL